MINIAETTENDVDLEYALALAIRLHQTGHLDDAEALYKTILDQFPNCPDALHFFGLLMHQKGDSERAIQLIEQSLVDAPNYFDAYNNLGNIYTKLDKLDKAEENYRKALKINPNEEAANNNLGIVLSRLSRFEEAEEVLIKAIDLMPDNPDFHRNLGNLFKRQGQFSKSASAYRQVLNLRQYNSENYEHLYHVLYLQGNFEEALQLVKQWLEHDPDNPLALHRWHSYQGDSSITRASDEYISRTFDSFSECFDSVLKHLDYKAPFLVADAVKEVQQKEGKQLHILDAGCGTGLCGPLLKPFAAQLNGVDLSGKMLDRARDRGCYDALFLAELTAFIAEYDSDCEVIVSADTLVYFGDLQPVFQAVAKTLVPGGYFVFTLERSEDHLPLGYQIHQHGRFSHTEAYIRHNLNGSGLSVLKLEKAMLRYETGVPVDGFLVAACKS